MQSIIHLQNIVKNYFMGGEAIPVLKNISLDIFNNEYVALMGPSGSGKSTLMNILGCLDTTTSGTYILNGEDVSKMADDSLAFRNKNIGFVFQFHHLLPEFTAIENVCIPGWISGKKKKDVQVEATEILQLLGLRERLNNKPQELSGGEQQRVAVARALINKPSIVFADEPTGNLDSSNAKELHDLFVQLRKEFNQTFLIVTHNEEMAAMSDRILHMKDGLIVDGRPEK
jgi:lipoprotein-releasing system ATP-binding protein